MEFSTRKEILFLLFSYNKQFLELVPAYFYCVALCPPARGQVSKNDLNNLLRVPSKNLKYHKM